MPTFINQLSLLRGLFRASLDNVIFQEEFAMLNDLNIHELYSNGIIKFRLEKDIAHLKNEYLNEINNCLIKK